MLRIGVLGSGSGTNFQAILDAIVSGRLDAVIVCVISDVKDAFILQRARMAEIPAFYIDCSPHKTKMDGDAEVECIRILKERGADTVVLAGFMRIVKRGLLEAFPQRVLNIHPSLLPAFPGLEAWKQALEYGVKITGCTVHFVDEGMDTGPIILQRHVPVMNDDTPETLHQRIQKEEYIAYPEALQLLSKGLLKVEGRKVKILGRI